MKSATKLIEEAADEICKNYCKYREQYAEKYQDPIDAEEMLESEQCDLCPLSKLF